MEHFLLFLLERERERESLPSQPRTRLVVIQMIGLAPIVMGKAMPARREAARVVRGEMSGTRVVLGTGRALKGTGPGTGPPVFLLREEEGERVMFVVVELAGLVRCAELESWEEDGERTVVSRLCQSSSPSSSSSLEAEAERLLLLWLLWCSPS